MRLRLRSLHGEVGLRHVLRGGMAKWAVHALPAGQFPAAHHRKLIAALEDVCSGRCDRLMVLMPPGSAKSTYGSVLFPAWWFAHHPGSQVIAVAHTASLAAEFGGRVRQLVVEYSRQLGLTLGARRLRHDFRLAEGGSYFAAGVHGAVTGRRADLILIDDPVKSREDADSERRRAHLWSWYRADLLTRLKPGGRVVLIMTRWHEDDLGGRLLAHDTGWRCLKLPALAGADDPMGRAPGAALWPAWEDEAALERKRALMGERAWAALFQQDPRPPGGTLFRAAALTIVDAAEPVACVRAWDLAATGQHGTSDPDWTVGLKLGREAAGRFVVLDVIRLRGSPHAVLRAIMAAARDDGRAVPVCLPQDPGQAGKAQISYLAGQLAGHRIHATPETGSKTTRAMPVASQIEAGNLATLRAPWTAALLDELAGFPLGRKDDQVDALSRAFSALTDRAEPARSVRGGVMER